MSLCHRCTHSYPFNVPALEKISQLFSFPVLLSTLPTGHVTADRDSTTKSYSLTSDEFPVPLSCLLIHLQLTLIMLSHSISFIVLKPKPQPTISVSSPLRMVFCTSQSPRQELLGISHLVLSLIPHVPAQVFPLPFPVPLISFFLLSKFHCLV